MPHSLVTELTERDRHLLHRSQEGFLPRQLFDIHAHLFHTRHFAPGQMPAFLEAGRGYGMADYQAALAQWLPGCKVEGLFFGYPSAGNDRAGENNWVQSRVAPWISRSHNRALVLAAPEDDPAEVRKMIGSGVFVGIKPYRLYAGVPDTREASIESFAPEWMWEICHEYEGVLMLHLVKRGGITDADNVSTLQRLCRRYPGCKVVLAHVARSFNYRHAREGLHAIADLENVVVDTAAVTHADAFRAALKTLGPQRVLWGSDYMLSDLRGSCATTGDGFVWHYADLAAASDTDGSTLVGIESLLCLREACEDLKLCEDSIQDIFRNNALRLLASHLPPGTAPAGSLKQEDRITPAAPTQPA